MIMSIFTLKENSLIGVCCFPLLNPSVEVKYIKMDSFTFSNDGELACPYQFTDGGDGSSEIYGCFLDCQKPLWKGYLLLSLGTTNPVRICNILFFQVYLPVCAHVVPVNKASTFNP